MFIFTNARFIDVYNVNVIETKSRRKKYVINLGSYAKKFPNVMRLPGKVSEARAARYHLRRFWQKRDIFDAAGSIRFINFSKYG